MKAIVSGQAGSYVTFTGTTATLHRVVESTVFQSDARIAPYAFPGTNDARLLEVSSAKDAETLVRREYTINRALRHFLILFEPRETDGERREVAEDVDDLFNDGYIVEGVSRPLYSAPVPIEHLDLVKSAAAGLHRLENFLTELIDHQPSIAAVRKSFDEIDARYFSTAWPRAIVREHAIEAGWFFELVRSVKASGDLNFLSLRMQANRQIDGIRNIVGAWIRDFSTQPVIVRNNRDEEVDVDEWMDFEEFDGAGGYQAGEQAKAQIANIVNLMKGGDLAAAATFADRLVESQTSPAYAAMSLCNLSQAAKRMYIWPLQLSWAQRAVELYPQDPVTFGHLVDGLITQRRFVEARNAADEVRARGNEHFADGAIARILRAQGLLVEARNQFVKLRDGEPGHPDAVHNYAGAAGTLRDIGRPDEALQEYDDALSLFPNAMVLLSGRSATLMALGRLPEALLAYNDLESIGEGLSAKNGRASILRQTGRLDESLAQYRLISKRFTFDPISAIGIADVLRLQGNLDEALAEYEESQKRFPFLAAPFIGAASALRDKGERAEAAATLRRALDLFPNDPDVLAEMTKSSSGIPAVETLHQLDALVSQYPQMFFAKVQRAETLRRLDRIDEAIGAFDDILSARPGYRPAINGKASALLVSGKVNLAKTLLAANLAVSPQSHDDWKTYLLVGLARAKEGDAEGAVDYLKKGLDRVPFDREARLMRAALASVHIAKMRPSAAVKVVGEGRADITGIVRLHALAFEQRVSQARQAYELVQSVDDNLVELRDEIARRYKIIGGKSYRNPRWILEQEQNWLIRLAA